MTQQNQPLISEAIEATPTGPKALLFAYKVYLLPDGNLQSSVSNVDPDTIHRVFTEAQMEDEIININVSTIRWLLNKVPLIDEELEAHIQSLITA